MELVNAGVLLIVAAVILYFVSRWHDRLALAARATELSSVSDLMTLHQLVVDEVGAGLFNQRVSLQGQTECEYPLQSELAGATCVAYRYRVERCWEEAYEERRQILMEAITQLMVRGPEDASSRAAIHAGLAALALVGGEEGAGLAELVRIASQADAEAQARQPRA
jgi:hypothetical protein